METMFNGVPTMTHTDQIKALIAELKLTTTQRFVPLSRSRNASGSRNPKDWSLNWKIDLLRDGRVILDGVDYQAGIGHCPAEKTLINPRTRYCIADANRIEWEVEHGTTAQKILGMKGKPILANELNFLHCMIRDSDVLDCATYEEWASEMGFDVDSRKGDAVYRACLDTALQMRARLGEDILRRLREAFQDY